MAQKKSVEIVIPIYNEEEELARNITRLITFLKKNIKDYSWRVVIADNASTDKSLLIAKALAKKYQNISYVHLNLKGRGRAVKKVWQGGKSDICVYMDVDLSTDLKSLNYLLKSFDNGYDIAIGTRLLVKSKVIGRPIKREILSRVYNILIKIAFWTKFSDAQCGFKAVSRKVVKDLIPKIADNAWFFDSELLIMGEKLGYRIFETPVIWVDNPGSTVRVLHTVKGDLLGLWRLFIERPWERK